MVKETPYELLKDDKKKQLDKNYETKITVYNALPRKEWLENDGVDSKTTKGKFKSLALKAKATREQTSDDSDSQGESDGDEYEVEAKEFSLMARNFQEVVVMALGIKALEAQDKSTFVTIAGKKVSSLVSVRNLRRTRLLSEEIEVIVKTAMNRKRTLHVSWQLTLESKINELELEVKKLTKSKEVVKSCQKCEVLTHEVDSLRRDVSKLHDEALNFLKFKKSSVVLDDMLSRQKLSQYKEGDAPARHQLARSHINNGVSLNGFVKPVAPQTCFANTRVRFDLELVPTCLINCNLEHLEMINLTSLLEHLFQDSRWVVSLLVGFVIPTWSAYISSASINRFIDDLDLGILTDAYGFWFPLILCLLFTRISDESKLRIKVDQPAEQQLHEKRRMLYGDLDVSLIPTIQAIQSEIS
ncbi:hypothetical protein Tco_1166873 [Tanacetum coccineum]